MKSKQKIQKAINELCEITRVHFCIVDLEGKVYVSTPEEHTIPLEKIKNFIHSEAENQMMQGFYFFKIYVYGEVKYILIAYGRQQDAYMMGQIAVSEVQNIMDIYKEKIDVNNFIQNLLSDNITITDLFHKTKNLHIDVRAKRVVFIIETKNNQDSLVLDTMKQICGIRTKDFLTTIDDKRIVFIKELKEMETYGQLQDMANMIRDTLNMEAMTAVRIAYGTIVEELQNISKSYKEAKAALEVGRLFYSDRTVVDYQSLGIGRLLYQLPVPLCELYIEEVFGEFTPDTFDEETIHTINKLFQNNLNISETARQLYIHRNTLVYRLEKIEKISGLDIRLFDDAMLFKIAMMVDYYIKYKKRTEKEKEE